MQAITTVGLDIAKSVFQVRAIDAEGNVIVRRQLERRGVVAFFQKLPPCLVGIEACASSHHWPLPCLRAEVRSTRGELNRMRRINAALDAAAVEEMIVLH